MRWVNGVFISFLSNSPWNFLGTHWNCIWLVFCFIFLFCLIGQERKLRYTVSYTKEKPWGHQLLLGLKGVVCTFWLEESPACILLSETPIRHDSCASGGGGPVPLTCQMSSNDRFFSTRIYFKRLQKRTGEQCRRSWRHTWRLFIDCCNRS